jgi:outer membrane usher protein
MVAPTLASYGQNQITVDVKNMPPDYSISTVNQRISPPVWSGSCVSFDVVKVRALTGTLFTGKGDKKRSLEFVDIFMNRGDREVTFPTGKGGEFYMENSLPEGSAAGAGDRQSCSAIAERGRSGGNVILPGAYQARVSYEGGNCEFTITFPETDEPITEVGEVVCTPVEPGTP